MPFMRLCEKKKCRVGQATDAVLALAHYMLDTKGHKRTPYAISIALPLQQLLHESVAMLRYTCSVYLVKNSYQNRSSATQVFHHRIFPLHHKIP
jgi:hypothetical protein